MPGHITPADARMREHADPPRRCPSLHALSVDAGTQGKVGIRIREAEERYRVTEAIRGEPLSPQHRVLERNREG